MEPNLSQQEALDMLQKMDILFAQQNLVYYAGQGDLNKVHILLKAGCNPNTPFTDDKKVTRYPLFNACGFGNVETAKYLLENGANINLQGEEDGDTALISAIMLDKVDIVKLLIDKGCDLNLKTKEGYNALFYAKAQNNDAIIKLLNDAGAEEMMEDEIKAIQKTKQKAFITKLVIGVAIIALIMYFYSNGSSSSSNSSNSSNSSSSSSSSGSHTCGQCNNSFSGNGWSTVGGEQYKQSSWSGYGYCSKSCAYDSQPSKWKK